MRDLKEKSVLVIEDNVDIRQFTFRVLDFEGYTVLQAGNGEEGDSHGSTGATGGCGQSRLVFCFG